MKRILIRASVSPFEVHGPMEVIRKRLIGNNSGNLLFAYSMTRTLYTEETEVDFLSDRELSKQKMTAEYINEHYDYLVLPMANSFRQSFVNMMEQWTALIQKLTIPCVVTGIGIQDDYEPDICTPHSYDDAVKRFISAVLAHSSTVGVRGIITEAYLKNLGFSQIDVIGCPSLAMFGPGLPVRKKRPLTSDSAVCVTGSVSNPVNFKEFMIRNREVLPNYYFVPQYVDDLKLIYLGIPLPETEDSQILYPSTIEDEAFINDRARFFINLPSILEFNKKMDFNYGTRIHGAVGCILSGVPSFLFPTDARIRELAEYHNIPNMPASEVNEATNLFEIYEKTDFSQVNQGHEERFWHFVDFLNENQLPHIYQKKDRSTVPMDERMKGVRYKKPVRPIVCNKPKEVARRMGLAQRLENYNGMREAVKRLEWYENSSALKIGAKRVYKKLQKSEE